MCSLVRPLPLVLEERLSAVGERVAQSLGLDAVVFESRSVREESVRAVFVVAEHRLDGYFVSVLLARHDSLGQCGERFLGSGVCLGVARTVARELRAFW